MIKRSDGQVSLGSTSDEGVYKELRGLLEGTLEVGQEYWNWPLVSLLTYSSLQRILNLNYVYDLQLKSAGSILEFGVHYGSSFAQLINLRSIKEPYNYGRHIYGFDTFSGFVGVTDKDASAADKDFFIHQNYREHLENICLQHEKLAPKNQLKKFSLLQGDAGQTLKVVLSEQPELIISMAIFDMDIYKPTREVLELIKPRLHSGSLLIFDEFNCPHFPGETQAVLEVLNIADYEIVQSPFLPFNAIFKVR